jgi:malate dehydrogenase (oxaloacetate-decarboxylating)(NADP+)
MTKISETQLKERALEYHRSGRPGKVSVKPTKPLNNQKDLALAYSPGVAAPCLEIAQDKEKIFEYTSRGNVVAVISNGTAVLGLGNIGSAASKPVMEGKAVLFKKFADIDAIDIEVDTENIDEFINSIRYLGNSWAGINLEDIKSPECFIIEEKLKELMDIPVFHDDQHGTAIISAAGMINALDITGKKFEEIKLVSNGAGAASIACIELLKKLGVKDENVILCDREGVIYKGRTDGMNIWKEKHATDTQARTLEDAMKGADVFLGLSVKDSVTQEMIKSMAKNPIIFAMANPDPEITPEKIKEVRNDAIIATGRSDYPNQVNNVMGFPYIFRGALDVRATSINDEMKIAAAYAIANLAKKPIPEEVYLAYGSKKMIYGKEYIIPVPFDPRLISTIPVAVAKAAMDSGVAKKQIDLNAYKIQLEKLLNPMSQHMDYVYSKISSDKQRVIFAEGETEEVVKAAISMRDKGLCRPILVGRESKILPIIEKLGSDYDLGHIQIINAAVIENFDHYVEILFQHLCRDGHTKQDCSSLLKKERNILASVMLLNNDGDILITGKTKGFYNSFEEVSKVVDPIKESPIFSFSIKVSDDQNIIIADTSIIENPTSAELANIAVGASNLAKSMGYKPKVAFLSFSNFGDSHSKSNEKIKKAIEILDGKSVDFEYDGEMTADIALDKNIKNLYPFCKLTGPANILVMPDRASASIATSFLKNFSGSKFVGPIISGFSKPVQIVGTSCTSNKIIKIAAFGCLEAINKKL